MLHVFRCHSFYTHPNGVKTPPTCSNTCSVRLCLMCTEDDAFEAAGLVRSRIKMNQKFIPLPTAHSLPRLLPNV